MHNLVSRISKTTIELGRLQVTTEFPSDQRGNNGAFHELYAFGTRSFSIWSSGVDEEFGLVFDSGDDFEQITAAQLGNNFNANDANDFDDGEPDNLDSRSDNKGPEPETVVVGEIDGRTYAFVGMERVGGIMIYDVTDPSAPVFESYVNRRDFTEPNTTDEEETMTNPLVGDLAVEGLVFIKASDSPTGNPLLVAANEVSGTTSIFEISDDEPAAAAALPSPDAETAVPSDATSRDQHFATVETFMERRRSPIRLTVATKTRTFPRLEGPRGEGRLTVSGPSRPNLVHRRPAWTN